MSERRDIEDAFDAFMDQADKVINIVNGHLEGDVVDAILTMAALLANVPGDLRRDCELDDYYNMVAGFAIETVFGSEVA